jgi:sugar/nucleoside kinase (ribokinase family)
VLTSDPVRPAGVLVTIVGPDGERSFLTDRGANLALSPSDMPEWLLDVTRLVLISGYSFFAEGPRAAVQWLCEEARARDIEIAVDPASAGFLREAGPENFLAWSQGAATIFANRDEAETLTGETELEAQMRSLGHHYGRVVIKRGALGAALGDASGVLIALPAPEVEVVDTTGAGDAFAAGFLASELRGEPLEARLRAGIEAGAKAVQQVGGQPG